MRPGSCLPRPLWSRYDRLLLRRPGWRKAVTGRHWFCSFRTSIRYRSHRITKTRNPQVRAIRIILDWSRPRIVKKISLHRTPPVGFRRHCHQYQRPRPCQARLVVITIATSIMRIVAFMLPRCTLPRFLTRHKLGIQRHKGRAGLQIVTLFE